jgi:hypothetical protein
VTKEEVEALARELKDHPTAELISSPKSPTWAMEKAIWDAYDDLMITWDEAIAAIDRVQYEHLNRGR